MQQEVIEKNNIYTILKNTIEEKSIDNKISSKDLIECYIKYINIVKDIYKNKKDDYDESLKDNRVINREVYYKHLKTLKEEVDSLLNDNIIITDKGTYSLHYSKYKIFTNDFYNNKIDIEDIYIYEYNHRNMHTNTKRGKWLTEYDFKYNLLSIIPGNNIKYKYFTKRGKNEFERYINYRDNTNNKKYDPNDWNLGLEEKFINYNGILDSFQIFYLYRDYLYNIHYTYKRLFDKYNSYRTILGEEKLKDIEDKLKDEVRERLQEKEIYLKIKDYFNSEITIKMHPINYNIFNMIYNDEYTSFNTYFTTCYENGHKYKCNGYYFIDINSDKIFEIDKEKHKLLQKNKA